MGVPSFFRWLIMKYPRVLTDCKEAEKMDVSGIKIPVDLTKENPNGVEFDNLYLDMNGIIHPCCHPVGGKQPESEDEMIVNVFHYIDHIFSIVRPRRLLYMAIDGVAPRAKMNQQRARRFKAAKEAEESKSLKEKIRREWLEKGQDVSEIKDSWDSNVITPGTPFMARLSECLHWYIHDRFEHNSAWRNIKVIFSDAKVPGEGEHKIMRYIRQQRGQKGYDPNQRHVVYGMDADLIMLSLASHEPHFMVIREKLDFDSKKCDICGQEGHFAHECKGEAPPDADAKPNPPVTFQFLHLDILREYLANELYMELPFKWDLERVIDDFILLCFFVGNDFLPHMPSLEIREGAIDQMMEIYRKRLPSADGYLTENGTVVLRRCIPILEDLGEIEDEVFRDRRQQEESQKRREKQRDDERKAEEDRYAAQGLESMVVKSGPTFKMACKLATWKLSQPEPEKDEVRFGEPGWRRRYYLHKMHLDIENPRDKAQLDYLFKSYAEGLTWVFIYYYKGCASWNWYYPFHYAPFASGLLEIDKAKIELNLSQPFSPIGQLMGVLPARSAHCMPPACRDLMVSPKSQILDFYPVDFRSDLNGKRYQWQAVVLLPFIDERRLLDALKTVEPTFTEEERERNGTGYDYLYVHSSHPLCRDIVNLYKMSASGYIEEPEVTGLDPLPPMISETEPEPVEGDRKESRPLAGIVGKKKRSSTEGGFEDEGKKRVKVEPFSEEDSTVNPKRTVLDQIKGGMTGYIEPFQGATLPGSKSVCPITSMKPINDAHVACAIYTEPPFIPHNSALLPGLIEPKKTLLTPTDFMSSRKYRRPKMRGRWASRPQHQGHGGHGGHGGDSRGYHGGYGGGFESGHGAGYNFDKKLMAPYERLIVNNIGYQPQVPLLGPNSMHDRTHQSNGWSQYYPPTSMSHPSPRNFVSNSRDSRPSSSSLPYQSSQHGPPTRGYPSYDTRDTRDTRDSYLGGHGHQGQRRDVGQDRRDYRPQPSRHQTPLPPSPLAKSYPSFPPQAGGTSHFTPTSQYQYQRVPRQERPLHHVSQNQSYGPR